MRKLYLIIALLICAVACEKPHTLETPSNETISSFLSYPYVTAIAEDATGHIWIGTTYGLNRAAPSGYHQYYAGRDSLSLQNNHIISLYTDHAGRLWVASKGGNLCYLGEEGTFHQVAMEYHEKVRISFLETLGGRLLCNDENSIFRYDEQKQQMLVLIDCPQKNLGFFAVGDNLIVIYPDCVRYYSSADGTVLSEHLLPDLCWGAALAPEGYLWLSTGDGTRLEIFNSVSMEPVEVPGNLTAALSGRRIQQLINEANDGTDMLINVSDDILCYDTSNGQIRTLREKGFSLDMQMYHISCAFFDSRDNIWVGTDGGGIQMLQNFHKWNRLQILLDYFKNTPVSSISFADNTVQVTDYRGHRYYYDLTEKVVTPIPSRVSDNRIPQLRSLHLHDGSTITVNDNSNIIVSLPDSDLGYIIPVREVLEVLNAKLFHPTTLFQDSRDQVWIGTKNDGLVILDLKTTGVRSVSGIVGKDISSIFEDYERNIWVATKNGLYEYDLDGNLIDSFFRGGNEGQNAYMDKCYCILPDGVILFGTMRGIVIVNPRQESQAQPDPLFLEDLRVHNAIVRPGKNAPIDKMMLYSPKVRLRHDQNSFGISFSGLNYWKPYEGSYSYMLEGYDKYWVDSGSSHEGFYSNVPPGKYTFRARMSKSVGEASSFSTASCEVVILSPPWAAWWALILYALAAVSLLFGVVYTWIRHYRKQEEAVRVQQEKEQEQHMNDIIKKYFANVAHQLRTPLTMIHGPIETLYASPSISVSDRNLIWILRNNTDRMLSMVNQIMNLNSLEVDALPLRVSRCDIGSVLEKTLDLYKVNANEKNIRFYTSGLDRNTIVFADSEKIVNILDNLLSNAFKFTPEGGIISVSFLTDDVFAEMDVKDNGPSVPEDKLESIFMRFYQVDSSSKGKVNWGSGIGLYYARKLAELHHGTLTCENIEGGNGVCFSLRFPITKDAFSGNEIYDGQGQTPHTDTIPASLPVTDKDPDDISSMLKPSVLVIDDDLDISLYLKTILGQKFKVRNCYDAESGLRALEDYAPDLIISDIMMEGMSGLDFCSRIKDDIQYSHIPLILLTAMDRVEDQISGLKTGADAYVTKPFNAEYLVSLAENLIEGRKRLQKRLLESVSISAEKELSAPDRSFLEQLYSIWAEQLSNTEFNISSVVDRLHISHTKFIYKVKGLTGFTPSELFKNYKLNKAAEMLREGKFNISEVADQTGFGTLAHFSRVFKKKFGVPPSEYKG